MAYFQKNFRLYIMGVKNMKKINTIVESNVEDKPTTSDSTKSKKTKKTKNKVFKLRPQVEIISTGLYTFSANMKNLGDMRSLLCEMNDYYFPNGFPENPTEDDLKEYNKRRTAWGRMLKELCAMMGMPDMTKKCEELYIQVVKDFADFREQNECEMEQHRLQLKLKLEQDLNRIAELEARIEELQKSKK
jgi:hypothetical protein